MYELLRFFSWCHCNTDEWLTVDVCIQRCEIWCRTALTHTHAHTLRHTQHRAAVPLPPPLTKAPTTHTAPAVNELLLVQCVSLVRPSLVGPHAARRLSADGCCRIPARCAPPPGCVALQMCQISSSVLLSPPDAHAHTHTHTHTHAPPTRLSGSRHTTLR